MPTVLLATDGSDYARVATEPALRMARDRDADLHVVSVVDHRKLPETALSTDELAAINAEDAGYDHLAEIKERAEESGVAVTWAFARDVPHERILREADRHDVDVIVLGEHGEHDGHLGGVGRAVAERADREVFVVPGRGSA